MPMLFPKSGAKATGWLFIYACRHPLVPHVESVVSSIVARPLSWHWCEQVRLPATVRVDVRWLHDSSSAGRIASALSTFPGMHAEVVVEPAGGEVGRRFLLAPELGLWSAPMDEAGETLISEAVLRRAMAAQHDPSSVIERLLGKPWENVLEPLRLAPLGNSASLLRVV